jgi:tRNA G18 (ribose-2'-O)-methylase SpoU
MSVYTVDSLDDPRLLPYRNLKDKELAREGGRFIAEGDNVVRRLLASSIPTESILLSRRKAQAVVPLAPANVSVFLASDNVIEQIIGFEFHSGVMACGLRPPSPALEQILPGGKPTCTLSICQQITNTENLGSLIRVSAAFGVDAMILGERCCDPFFRQSVRVSMGAVFSTPIVRSDNLLHDLRRLRERWDFCLAAAVLDAGAEPLASAGRAPRMGLVFGNEADGLDEATMQACDRRVTIPMRRGVDSLNVAVATGIFLYHFTRFVDPPA